MMNFAFIGGQSLRVFVVVFVRKIFVREEFFVVGFCLEQFLHGKIKFQKTTFSIQLLYSVLLSSTNHSPKRYRNKPRRRLDRWKKKFIRQ